MILKLIFSCSWYIGVTISAHVNTVLTLDDKHWLCTEDEVRLVKLDRSEIEENNYKLGVMLRVSLLEVELNQQATLMNETIIIKSRLHRLICVLKVPRL